MGSLPIVRRHLTKYFWLNTLRKADEVLLANILFLEFLNMGMEESGQPRWFWEPEHAVMASASSNLATHSSAG